MRGVSDRSYKAWDEDRETTGVAGSADRLAVCVCAVSAVSRSIQVVTTE